ncbi:hypothetical protein GCM10023317_02540 [Actinopolymorpha pittospori]
MRAQTPERASHRWGRAARSVRPALVGAGLTGDGVACPTSVPIRADAPRRSCRSGPGAHGSLVPGRDWRVGMGSTIRKRPRPSARRRAVRLGPFPHAHRRSHERYVIAGQQ